MLRQYLTLPVWLPEVYAWFVPNLIIKSKPRNKTLHFLFLYDVLKKRLKSAVDLE